MRAAGRGTADLAAAAHNRVSPLYAGFHGAGGDKIKSNKQRQNINSYFWEGVQSLKERILSCNGKKCIACFACISSRCDQTSIILYSRIYCLTLQPFYNSYPTRVVQGVAEKTRQYDKVDWLWMHFFTKPKKLTGNPKYWELRMNTHMSCITYRA